MNQKVEVGGALFVLFIGIAFTIAAYQIPEPMLLQDVNTSVGFFPITLGIMFSLVSLGLLKKAISSPTVTSGQPATSGVTNMKPAIAVICILLVYIIIMQIIGWMVSSFLMTISVFKIAGKKGKPQNNLLILFLGFLITGMVFIIFDLLLGVPLPRGLFSPEILMGL